MGFVKKFLRNLSILIALVATAIGLVGKHAPHLFMKLPMGFIPWARARRLLLPRACPPLRIDAIHPQAITGHFVPPYFDNTMWLDSGLREWVRDGDVVVAVGAKSGTTWMCYCADAIRRKGIKEGNGLLPYRDIMYTTPWLEASQKPGETWAERAAFYESHVFEDGSRLKDYWDNEAYPFRAVWKSNLRRVCPESPRRPPRHRRDACSMVDFHTGSGSSRATSARIASPAIPMRTCCPC
jgi:hypothetical protein